jgi:succinoglycan biosynthesis protein ExoA
MPDAVLATVVIPMRNEEEFIVPCLDSLRRGTAPGPIEFLVYDGESTDRSCALVSELAAADPRVVLVPNPRRVQSAAFNDAVRRARGEYLLRADAHALYPDGYVADCIRLLRETGAANVGGLVHAGGRDFFSSAVAAALGSRFAVGDAQYRVATQAGWVDTVFPGAWRTETLRELGGMREDWLVNEDAELNLRLRQAGGRIYLSPALRPTLFTRSSVPRLIRQYVRYGFWVARTVHEHPGSLRWRQAVAPAFVVSLVAAVPLVMHFGAMGAAHVALYLLANLVASVLTARRAGWRYLAVLPLVFFLIHVAWGSGFLAGTCYWRLRRRDRE